MSLLKYIQLIPKGYSEVLYQQKKYGVTRTDFNNGKSIKVFAKELGGNDFISMNYYITRASLSSSSSDEGAVCVMLLLYRV